ncbi:MAG: hypothetical protein ABR863_13865, partial [Roseiarcus sp.]
MFVKLDQLLEMALRALILAREQGFEELVALIGRLDQEILIGRACAAERGERSRQLAERRGLGFLRRPGRQSEKR